jgi:CheY-like chemotaxis protein
MNDDKNIKALVIDDELILYDMFSEILTKKGCEVDAVETCGKGIDKIIESEINQYDLILTDLKQEPSGVDVVNAVRRTYEKNIPIYILTGGAPEELEREAKQLARDDPLVEYIEKPIMNIMNVFDSMIEKAKEVNHSE